MKKDISAIVTTEIENQKTFNSPSAGQVTFKEVIFNIGKFIYSEPDVSYEIIIGSDSQCYNSFTDFVSAIIVHRQKGGGIYFWRRYRVQQKNKYVLRDRMYQEAMLSIELAREFLEQFQLEGMTRFSLEIHVDIGEIGKTRELIKEVIGMVAGHGFIVKTKPQAFGATNIADRHT